MVQGTPGQTRPQKPCLLRESLHRVWKPRAFKRGLFSKGAGFYQTALEMVILGIAFIACTLIVFSAVAVTAGSLADRLRTPAVQYWLNKTAAVIFTVLAACTLLLE